jgi:hypothetical protein
MTRSLWPVNWLQGMEAALDTAHVGHLHSGWARPPEDPKGQSQLFRIQPRFTVEETAYGMRLADVRAGDDGMSYVRISELLAPFTVMTPGALDGAKGRPVFFRALGRRQSPTVLRLLQGTSKNGAFAVTQVA